MEVPRGTEVVDADDLISIVEKSFSSPTYSILKRREEAELVLRAHAKPKFVEDVTRGVIDAARKRFPGCKIHVKTISQESIHRHDVIAESNVDA